MPKTSVQNQEKSISAVTVALALRTNLANKRLAVAHTKDRSEVRGGGKKPWRQKGTGRARHGSTRSPIWVGGGITFGPRNTRNFALSINKKQKNLAISQVLASKKADNLLKIVDPIPAFSGKTKEMAKFISDNGISGKVIFVLDNEFYASNSGLAVIRSAKNYTGVTVIPVKKLNVYHLAANPFVVTTQGVVDLFNS